MHKICLVLCGTVSYQWTSLEKHLKRLLSVDLLWLPKTRSSSLHVKSAIWIWNTSSAAHTGLLKQWPHAPNWYQVQLSPWLPTVLKKKCSCFTNESLKKWVFPGLLNKCSHHNANRASSVSWRSSWYCATRIQKSSSSRPGDWPITSRLCFV